MKRKIISFACTAVLALACSTGAAQKYTDGTRLLKGAEVLSATPLQLDYVLETLADTAKITVNLHEGKTHLVLNDGSGKWREWWYYMGKWQVKTGERGSVPGIPGNNSWNIGGNPAGGKMGTTSAGRVNFITDNKNRAAITPSGDIKLMNPSVESNWKKTPANNYLAIGYGDSVLTTHHIYSLNELLHERIDIALGYFQNQMIRIFLPSGTESIGSSYADSTSFFAVKIMFECHSRDLQHYMLGEAWLYSISSRINIQPAVEYKIVKSTDPDALKNSVRFIGLYRNDQDTYLTSNNINTQYIVLSLDNKFRVSEGVRLTFRATVVDMIRKSNPYGVSGQYNWSEL